MERMELRNGGKDLGGLIFGVSDLGWAIFEKGKTSGRSWSGVRWLRDGRDNLKKVECGRGYLLESWMWQKLPVGL